MDHLWQVRHSDNRLLDCDKRLDTVHSAYYILKLVNTHIYRLLCNKGNEGLDDLYKTSIVPTA